MSRFNVNKDPVFNIIRASGLTLGGTDIFVYEILNEDDMSSDSPFALATQASIKAYVDSSSGGDVNGPASSTDSAIARFNGITGKLIENSGLLLNDNVDLIFEKPTNNLTIFVLDQTVAPVTATIIDLLGQDDDFLFANANQDAMFNNVVINNDLTVFGTTTTFNVQTLLVGNNAIILNFGYVTPVAKASAIAANYLPTALTDTVGVGGFTAGVAGVSNPTVITVGAGTFAMSDIVQVSSANTNNNNGIYEVLSHVGTTLTIRGVGLTDTVEPWTGRQFTTDAVVAGVVTKVNVSILEFNTSGVAQLGTGSVTPITTIDIVTTTGTQDLSNKTLITPIVNGNITFEEATNNLILVVTDQTVGISTATVPDLAGTSHVFMFIDLSQIVTNKTFSTNCIWNGDTITPTYGGTGLSNPASGNVLITAGAGNMTLKTNPTGAFVGTTDAQVLTNKTITDSSNTVTARFLGTTGADVDIDTTIPSGAGQTLVTTNATTATWQNVDTFGSEHEIFSSTVVTTFVTQFPTFTNIINVTTASKPAGTYVIYWEFDWNISNTTRAFLGEIQVDTVSQATYSQRAESAAGTGAEPFALGVGVSAFRRHYTGFFEITFGATATHDILVHFAYGTDGSGAPTLAVQNTRVIIYRIS